jgi:uncharacterized membrane protein
MAPIWCSIVGFRVTGRNGVKVAQQTSGDEGASQDGDGQGSGLPESGSSQAGAGPGEPPRAASRIGRHWLGVGLLTALAAAAYSAFALIRFHTYLSASYDLVIFDQAVRSYAHLQPGISVMKGLHNGFGPHFSVLGDHWSPILAVLAPLYWVSNSPVNLLVAQAVLFALAIPWVWLFTRRAFGGGAKATAAAYLVSAAYALSWPIASALAFDFHEVAFAPLLIAIALERLQAGRLRTALIALAALLLVKEDMGFLIAGIGIYLAVDRPGTLRRPVLTGLILVAVGLAASVVSIYVLIPAFGGHSGYYWAYGALGGNVPQVIGHIIVHPVSSLRMLVTPRVKLETLLWLFGAFCFLPLRSPLTLAAVPLLLERMLDSKFPNWWVTEFHYNAYLVIILVFAAVDGAARLDRDLVRVREYFAARRRRGAASLGLVGGYRGTGTVALACSVAMIAVAIALVPRFAFGVALQSSFYHRTLHARAEAAAAAAVPPGVTVEAVNYVGPHLSGRDTVLLWDGDGSTPRFPPWVVADVRHREFTWPSKRAERQRAERQRVALLERHGYQVTFRRAGYLVLRAPGAGP